MNARITDKLTDLVDSMIINIKKNKVLPWQKPWAILGAEGLPVNGITEREYSGCNLFFLTWVGAEEGYQSPNWAGFHQWKKEGRFVRKGAHGARIFLPLTKTIEEEDGSKKSLCYGFKSSVVFNECQLKDYEAEPVKAVAQFDTHERAQVLFDQYINRLGSPSFGHGLAKAFYSPSRDHVEIPAKGMFYSQAEYYNTLFHECAHSTGHKSRLDRLKLDTFGSHSYSKEELIAELTASFLCNYSGVQSADGLQNSEAYLNGWINVLKANPEILLKSAAAAQKAINYFLEGQAA